MYKNKLTFKIILFLLFSDILETFTHFCFKKAALPQSAFLVTNFTEAFVFVKCVASSGFLWVGLLSVLSTFVIWSTILSRIDLSVAVPIASFSYILVPLVSLIILHEQISLLDWTGICFILIGVIFVSISTKEKEII